MLDKSFDPKEAEARIYKMWEDSGAFKPRAAKPTDTKDDNYSIVIPPPNVTGSLHMGHALNNTIMDILIRFNRMKGKAVLWQPGMDHAGIATQMVVERKLAAEGKFRKNMSREDFLNHVWDWKAESGGMIEKQLRRLGSSCDWSRSKFTLGAAPHADKAEVKNQKNMADAVTKAFVEMYEAGLIYRDKRLVNWDPHFQTAISDLEVENIEKNGHFWHFKYPLAGGETYTYVEKDENGNVTLSEERDYISIATTRPETMLGDGAVAVHPDDERYAPIVGKMVRLPLADRLIPIITDEYPDMDFGSGAVKITGAHDFNDYEVAKRNDIPMYSLMGTRGEMIESEIMPAKYVGMDRFAARKAVVADIDAEGLLIRVEDKKIMQPYGDRSGVVIEPMLTDQWFVDAEKMAEDAMAKVNDGSTKFVPENWKKTYDHWMENIQPWCVSRQLWWGHQIPAWYGPAVDPETKEIDWENPRAKYFVADNEANMLGEAALYYSAAENDLTFDVVEDDCDFSLVAQERRFDNMVPLQRDADVLDTWFSSGLWPFSTLGWPDSTEELARFYPTSVLVTAFDIIFFWVARMMMQGLHFMKDENGEGVVPFDDVYIHALVLDEAGKKMSKSIGNTLDPLDLIDGVSADTLVEKRTRGLKNPDKAPQIAKATRKAYPDGFEPYGADALRFTLASQAGQGRNIRLSVDRIAGYRNFGTKLWSAASFGQMNGCTPVAGFDPSSATLPVNKWIISETAKTAMEISRCIDTYRFNDAADAAYKFTWDTFCAWYLELSKPLLSGEDGTDKDETRATFAWVLDQILKLLHPFMPFITEDLWAKIGKGRDTHLITAQWPTYGEELIDVDAVAELEWLQTLITNIRSVRADMNIPPSKKAPLLLCGDTLDPRLETYAPQLSPMARVEHVELAAAVPENALQTVVDGVQYAIPLAGLIDMDAERKRLAKEIEKAQSEIEKIDRKLGNEAFVAKAPEKVVTLQKERRAGYAAEVETLQAALDGLG
ncbi:valine--tRNA ligase [Litorimonas cladophorae]|uniref:Valine--tRNA ligase n=1 Tax=Litorimonas cladophorae TaxID=1220491 RepID=A0A918N9U2_9PROT|nr:valine--tRNA ligase [Litorimonas cladophorae]GGX57168.1 valine--tRNA ligase [Litorimonas cladophorae]